MKPPRFDYHAPGTLREALETLTEFGDDAAVLAGGQSLLPMLNFRLANPAHVVDLGSVPALDAVALRNGSLEVGGMVTHRRMERDPLVGQVAPLAQRAAGHIGYPAIRNRGTVGGSVAHADPAAEWPIVVLALDGEIRLAAARGCRTVSGEDFFRSTFTTARRNDEVVTSVRLGTRFARHWGFSEFQRRVGDFATVAVAVGCVIESGSVLEARVAIAGVTDRPLRCREAEQVLLSGAREPERDAAAAARDAIQPVSDCHGSAAFRKRLVFAETLRAATQALSRRRGNAAGA